MVLKPVTEYTVTPIGGSHIRPFEAVSVFQMKLIPHPCSAGRELPRRCFGVREAIAQIIQRALVVTAQGLAVPVQIPKSEDGQNAIPGSFVCKVQYVTQIRTVGAAILTVLKAVNGDIHLVDPRLDQLSPPLGEKGAVGGDGGLEALGLGQADEVGQVGVGQWLPHDVVVEVFRDPLQTVGDGVELRNAHAAQGTGRPGAKGAGAVAYVGDFNVNT